MTQALFFQVRRKLLCVLALAGLAACAQPQQASDSVQTQAKPVTPLILISIDGFKPEYLQRGVTPNLNKLAQQGVRAEAMSPSFPSITFPNHYTIVTGLRPDHHGIVGNTMEDPAIPDQRFSLSNHAAVSDARWWDQAEPIWVTAEKNGMHAATMFWPGTEAAIHGVRPSEWRPFDGKVTPDQRVDTVLRWLDKPVSALPGFLTLYFDDVDHSGHEYGPDAVQTTQAAALVDAAIGRLLKGLQEKHITANIVIISDHGMAAISKTRVIRLDQIAPEHSFRMITGGTYAGVEAQDGQETALAAALLKPQEHMQCWRREQIPARFVYGQNPRVPHFICLADVGWTIVADQRGEDHVHGGSHGYDNRAPEMQAIFIANGPAFRSHVVLAPFDNVDVYPLVMKVLGLPALANDGNLTATQEALH